MRKVADACLKCPHPAKGQEIAAKNHYSHADSATATKYANQFQKVEIITLDQVFCVRTKE
jgi:sulfate transport system substrate-binding protein